MVSVLMGLKAKSEDIERIKLVFKLIDKNNDGYVDKNDVKEVNKELKLCE